MTERERLVKLLKSDSCESPMLCDPNCKYASLKRCYEERTADYLLENGVIVPPVKVGDTFFYLYFSDDEKKYQIDELKVLDVSTKKVFINEFGDTIGIDEFGTTAFINYTAAKEAVERLNNEK